MQVETYEAKTPEGQPELVNDPEAERLIAELGLEGQREMMVERTVDGHTFTERNPFRLMTDEEQRIYGLICPMITKLTAYKSEPIPVEVLKVAARAKPLFRNLVIWHPTDARYEDPLLVGYTEAPVGSWEGPRGQPYLLARWGRVLLPLEELRVMAAEKLRADWRAAAAKVRAALDVRALALDELVDAHLRGGELLHIPNTYGY
jgi:hypothetical protein